MILLDVVLGYGSNPDPAAELGSVLRKAARKVCGGVQHHRHGPGPAEPQPGGNGAAQSGRDRDALQRRGVQAGGADYPRSEGITMKPPSTTSSTPS